MSRQTWMDRTIEAARTETAPLPWTRKDQPAPAPAPVKVGAKG